MLEGLKTAVTGVALLREVTRLREEFTRLTSAVERIAAALELRNTHDYPPLPTPDPDAPPLEIAYVNDAQQEEWMDIELRLTQARGMPPTEDEILGEFHRRHQTGDAQELPRG